MMITIFHVSVFILLILAVALFVRQRNKTLILRMSMLSGLIGLFIELNGVLDESWSWSDAGETIRGVPYIAIIPYFLGGTLAASFVVDPEARRFIDNVGDKLYCILMLFGAMYAIFSKQIAFVVLVLGLYFYSRHHEHTYFLKISALFAVLDIIAENSLIYLGYLEYAVGYSSGIYLGVFIGVFFIMSLTDSILKNPRLIKDGQKYADSLV